MVTRAAWPRGLRVQAVAPPLALIFGELLLGGILIDHGVKDFKSGLGAGSSAGAAGSSAPTAQAASAGGGGGTAGDQKTFGQELARISGLSPQFVDAWLLHEQPPGSPSAPGSNNWLNIGAVSPNPADWTPTYWQIARMNAKDAALATWQWLQANQPSIAAAAGQGAAAQVTALENSGWASSHYGYQAPATFLGEAG